MGRLLELLRRNGVDADERRFSSVRGIDGLVRPFVSDLLVFCELEDL